MTLKRTTRETTITLDADVGTGEPKVQVRWDAHGGLDEAIEPEMATHLFTALLRYAGIEGSLDASGDLAHHVIEDTAIVVGRRIGELADGPVTRYSDRAIPMDDALVTAALDLGGRAHYHSDLRDVSPLWDHVLRTIAHQAGATLHVYVMAGHDPHHIVEAALKATGTCVRDALVPTDRIQSTKGAEAYDEGA